MRARAHTLIAASSAVAAIAVIKHRAPDARLPHPLFAAAVAAFSAGLPDILEPANCPHHRQFCHSVAFAALLGTGLKQVYDWQPNARNEVILRELLLSAGIGYLSHLGADATTAMGLPLLGRIFQEQ